MHQTFYACTHPKPNFIVMAEMFTFGIFRGRNVQAVRSVAEMSVAEMSEHRSHSVAVTIGNCGHKVKVFDIPLGLGVVTND